MNNPYQSPVAADPGAEGIDKSLDAVSLPNRRPAFFYALVPLMLLAALVFGRMAMKHGANFPGSNSSVFDEAASMSIQTILRTWLAPTTAAALVVSAFGLWAGKRFGWWMLLAISCFVVGQSLPLLYWVVSKSGFQRMIFFHATPFCLRVMLLIYCFSSGPMRFCKIGNSEGNKIMPVVAGSLFAGICVAMVW